MLLGRHKKQRTANEYYVKDVDVAHPKVHYSGDVDIWCMKKLRLIVIAYGFRVGSTFKKPKQFFGRQGTADENELRRGKM